ncbi:MAG: hypothetical protein M3443_13855, partial [Actinomycetota bacterium]|nr:hypothetical protein [Actinomycetota bacterium]
WDLTLDRRPDLKRTWAAIKETGSVAITHVMEIRRNDGATFSGADVTPLLETMHYGVSFALARWTPPALPVGLDADGHRAWEEWAPVICDAGGAPSAAAWWTSGSPDELVELLSNLLPRFESADSFATKFLLASSVEAGLSRFVEHRVLAAFSAIEQLSWTILKLRDGRTRAQYDEMDGACRLTKLLNRAKVPLTISTTHLTALAAFAKANKKPGGPLDGPTAVVRVRNKIVHPKALQQALYDTPRTIQDAWRLTCDYLRLLILREIGYVGTYQPFIDLVRLSGNTDPVPWASPRPMHAG